MKRTRTALTSVEICAGAGGQALGLEHAGFEHLAAVEIDGNAWETLKLNRPQWNPKLADAREIDLSHFKGADLFAGGVPCPPFSVAGRQLGAVDSRDLFPTALDLVEVIKPRAVLLENVPGFGSPRFAEYRGVIVKRLYAAGYSFVEGKILHASDFGVPQLRPRFLLVALRGTAARRFEWPKPLEAPPATVGETLFDLMSGRHWRGAAAWRGKAASIAPTLVGGSKLHGGPDLGPTRAKAAWRLLGVDGRGLADAAPDPAFPHDAMPKLTLRMTARIQGFPDSWQFSGKKTASYRQIGNAFPPPVAEAIGHAIHAAITGVRVERTSESRRSTAS